MGEMASPPPNPSFLIFTSFSNPLPRKYPHPHKPNLLIPPLIHRTLHTALDKDPPSTASTPSGLIIPHPDFIIKHDLPALPSKGGSERRNAPRKDVETTLDTAQPTSNVGEDGLSRDEDTDAEVTVKLHLVGPSPPAVRLRWIAHALDALGRYKGLGEIDTLLVGFRGVDYKGKKSAVAEVFGCGAEGMENGSGGEAVENGTAADVEKVWRAMVEAKSSSAKAHVPNGHFSEEDQDLEDAMAHVKSLGTLYMPLGLLESLSKCGQAPCINSMDTPDCHHLPREYTEFAKERGIELWAGGGGEGSGECLIIAYTSSTFHTELLFTHCLLPSRRSVDGCVLLICGRPHAIC